MAEDSVIAALRSALVASPGDDGIRRHLADLLVAEGRAGEGLCLYQDCLRRRPHDKDLIRATALAARLCGELDEAAAHERALGSEDLRPMGVPDGAGEARPEPLATSSSGDDRLVSHDAGRLTLADVGGLDEVKARLHMAFLAPVQDPGLSAYYGKSPRGGLLLYGPPGCGKTYVARALAGELGAQFHSVSISDVLDMWLGRSERNMHSLFEAARRSEPALVFLDELDALGRKRSAIVSAGRTVVNQLLTELDGIGSDNEGLFVLGATNQPWDVDTALRRPGRFDRMVFVSPPDASARAEILALHLRGRPTANLELGALGAQLDGFTGADLAHVCETAVELAMQEAMRTGDRRPISQRHLSQAAQEVRPSSRAWLEIAQSVAMFGNSAGEYDELVAYLRAHELA